MNPSAAEAIPKGPGAKLLAAAPVVPEHFLGHLSKALSSSVLNQEDFAETHKVLLLEHADRQTPCQAAPKVFWHNL